jgi:hypothetical protein
VGKRQNRYKEKLNTMFSNSSPLFHLQLISPWNHFLKSTFQDICTLIQLYQAAPKLSSSSVSLEAPNSSGSTPNIGGRRISTISPTSYSSQRSLASFFFLIVFIKKYAITCDLIVLNNLNPF